MSHTLNIGLFGFGCVGQGFYDALHNAGGVSAQIAKIGVKDTWKKRKLSAQHFSYSRSGVLEQPGLNAVVEAVAGADDGFEIVSDALRNGLPVITANKKMVAEHFTELWTLQHQHNSHLLYEAAVAGSIPIIRLLDGYYQGEEIKSLQGILNGSSNYIITQMERDGLSYPTALDQAQTAGFAEADPWLDVAGYDPKYKLVILAAHAFGVVFEPDEVINLGIPFIDDVDIAWGKEQGLKIRLIADVRSTEQGIAAYVLPHFIGLDNDLYTVNDEFNAVLLDGAYTGKHLLKGKGAGSYPTGSAVLADVAALEQGYRYTYSKIRQRGFLNGSVKPTKPFNEVSLKIYARAYNADDLALIDFDTIEQQGDTAAGPYTIGTVSLEHLRVLQQGKAKVFVAVL